uniref:WW domain binding protein VOPP1 n=1 Tax=Sphaeramia orbicularis TaxID=375764 RepID=A0A673C314_9TELE
MMGVLFCCGAGFFIRRRMYPSPLREEPAFNVSFTRHPVTSPVSQQPGSMVGFGVNGMTGDPGVPMIHPAYPAQPGSAHMMMSSYPPPPSYCNHPPTALRTNIPQQRQEVTSTTERTNGPGLYGPRMINMVLSEKEPQRQNHRGRTPAEPQRQNHSRTTEAEPQRNHSRTTAEPQRQNHRQNHS